MSHIGIWIGERMFNAGRRISDFFQRPTPKICLPSIVLMLVLSGCASTGHELSSKQLQDMGEKYVQAGDTANALKCLTEAEKGRPGDAVIQYDLGLAYNRRGLQNEALLHFQKALKINPAYPEAWNAIGTVYAEKSQFELAQEAFQKAVNDPFYQTPQLAAYNLARLYEKKDDTERALSQYQRAVQFDPSYGLAWYHIGQIMETMKKGDEARHAYGKAVTASPDLAEAHLRYGIMSYLAGDMDAALFSLSKVGRLAPDSNMADEARKYLEKLRGVTTRSVLSNDIEVISNSELQRQRTKSKLPPPAVKLQPAPIMEETTMQPRPVPGDEPAVSQGRAAEAPEPSYKYIVQLGSFVDRDQAELMKKDLTEKGYAPVVKSIEHQVLGKVFVIQLKPETSISKATTLMTQLGSQTESEPVLIKVPAEHRDSQAHSPAQ